VPELPGGDGPPETAVMVITRRMGPWVGTARLRGSSFLSPMDVHCQPRTGRRLVKNVAVRGGPVSRGLSAGRTSEQTSAVRGASTVTGPRDGGRSISGVLARRMYAGAAGDTLRVPARGRLIGFGSRTDLGLHGDTDSGCGGGRVRGGNR